MEGNHEMFFWRIFWLVNRNLEKRQLPLVTSLTGGTAFVRTLKSEARKRRQTAHNLPFNWGLKFTSKESFCVSESLGETLCLPSV